MAAVQAHIENVGVPRPPRKIVLQVVTPMTPIFVRVKTDIPFWKVKNKVIRKTRISRRRLKFIYEGHVIRDNETPTELGMRSNVIIDAFHEQCVY